LSASVAGCTPKKVVAALREQRPGQVTYSHIDGKPVWTTTGSAKYLKTVGLKQSFARVPHFTYVVFRDKQRNEDHVIALEAAGDLTLRQDEVELKDESCLYRVVEVRPDQPRFRLPQGQAGRAARPVVEQGRAENHRLLGRPGETEVPLAVAPG
jgi:hypothetical protein